MTEDDETVTGSFLKIFSKYCSDADLSRDQLIGQLAERIQEPDKWKDVLRYALLIDEPIQLEAEKKLYSLIRAVPKRLRTIQRWTDVPSRHVDWAHTRIATLTGRHGEFCSLERATMPDVQLLQAMAGLVSRWRRMLEVVPDAYDKDNRIRQLKEVELLLPGGQCPWSLAISRRLRRIDDKATTTLESAIRLWEGEGNRGKGLADQFEKWLKSGNAQAFKAKNQDTLFEWMVALSIAKVAVNPAGVANQNNPWILTPANISTKKSKYVDILLKRNKLILRISKGKPRDGNDQELKSGIDDNIIKIAQLQAGLTPTGFQPDVVLTFFHESKPKITVTFFADAKRNQNNKDGGRGYISPSIQKAAAYVHAFKELFPPTPQPQCTLFFWQGIHKILDVGVGDDLQTLKLTSEVVRNMNAGNKIPAILCFDKRMMDNEDILSAWLTVLAERAVGALESVAANGTQLET